MSNAYPPSPSGSGSDTLNVNQQYIQHQEEEEEEEDFSVQQRSSTNSYQMNSSVRLNATSKPYGGTAFDSLGAHSSIELMGARQQFAQDARAYYGGGGTSLGSNLPMGWEYATAASAGLCFSPAAGLPQIYYSEPHKELLDRRGLSSLPASAYGRVPLGFKAITTTMPNDGASDDQGPLDAADLSAVPIPGPATMLPNSGYFNRMQSEACALESLAKAAGSEPTYQEQLHQLQQEQLAFGSSSSAPHHHPMMAVPNRMSMMHQYHSYLPQVILHPPHHAVNYHQNPYFFHHQARQQQQAKTDGSPLIRPSENNVSMVVSSTEAMTASPPPPPDQGTDQQSLGDDSLNAAANRSVTSKTSAEAASVSIVAPPTVNKNQGLAKAKTTKKTATTAAASKKKTTESQTCVSAEQQQKRVEKNERREAGRPKRPLSAYNLYFKDERAKMITANANKKANEGSNHQDETTAKGEVPSEGDEDDGGGGGGDAGDGEGQKKKRKSNHGIGFETMARQIAKKWRELDAATLAHYEAIAEVHKKRYDDELAQFNERRRNGIEERQKLLESTISVEMKQAYLDRAGESRQRKRRRNNSIPKP